jgi:4-hydroxybutyrate dehydrogenase / sulfolactaldehyde 3-reductase
MTNVAFIGLGLMGQPMAERLARAGVPLAVYDKRADSRAAFADLPARVAASAADAARQADIVITMLPTTAHVRDVLFGEGEVAAAMKRGGLVIDMSTGDATQLDALARDLHAAGLRLVDAPVARSRHDAKAGTLMVLAGGERRDIDEAMPLFEHLADTIEHVGPLGAGLKLKLVNNYMAMVNMVIAGEGLMLARKLGIDRAQAVRVLSSTAAGRGQLTGNFPKKVLAGDITPDFPLAMGHKDLSMALALASSVGAPLFLGGAARELYALASSWGRANDDCSAMLLLLEDIAHL